MRRRLAVVVARVRAFAPLLRLAAGAVAGIAVLAALSGGVGPTASAVAYPGAYPVPSPTPYPIPGRLFLAFAPRDAVAGPGGYPMPTRVAARSRP